ncbi:MAG: hypothetical protein KGZ79_11875 [Dethiobacter sp.]|jgi:hypothetical protein|nr:hypothetical protein [Dethiobacter sp.]
MALVIFFAISLVAALLILPFLLNILRYLGHLQKNYTGRDIPQSMGSVLMPVYALAVAWALFTGLLPYGLVLRAAIIVFGFGLAGLADDMFGDDRARGFAGHFRSVLAHGEITTGFIKAAAGFLFAMWAVAGLPGFFLFLFWRAALVALSANLFNILDLRPGRALKVFFLLSLIYAWLAASEIGILLLFPCWLALLAYFPYDLRSYGMLGDAGANILGGLLGLVIVLTAPLWLQSVYMLFLVLIHIITERISLTELIAANPVLNYLDMLGRKDWN